MSGFDNEFGGGTFKIIDAIPPAHQDQTPTTGGGIADTPLQTELLDALGMDELVQAASDPFQKQIYYPDGVNYYYSFGDYFVFANKNPLPESLNGVVGFSRDALFTETGNTAIVSAETSVGPQNNVRDPVRKVTRNIWTSTDDFKNVELFGSPTALYDDDLTLAENVGNTDFNKEKMPVVVLFPEGQPGQDDIYTTSGRGEPIRKNKFVFVLPQRLDRDEGFERAEGLAVLTAMFKPHTRTDLGYEFVLYTSPPPQGPSPSPSPSPGPTPGPSPSPSPSPQGSSPQGGSPQGSSPQGGSPYGEMDVDPGNQGSSPQGGSPDYYGGSIWGADEDYGDGPDYA
jgi:hypothetical protein